MGVVIFCENVECVWRSILLRQHRGGGDHDDEDCRYTEQYVPSKQKRDTVDIRGYMKMTTDTVDTVDVVPLVVYARNARRAASWSVRSTCTAIPVNIYLYTGIHTDIVDSRYFPHNIKVWRTLKCGTPPTHKM